MSRTRRPRPSQKQRLSFSHELFLFSTSSRCFEADKVANFFLSFFYVQRKHIIFLYEEAARSLTLFWVKKHCWNRSRTKELVRNVREKPYKDFLCCCLQVVVLLVLFRVAQFWCRPRAGDAGFERSPFKRSSVLLPHLPYRARCP